MEISTERSIVYNPEYKGVRLDVYARDEKNTCYDIEMQVAREKLGKRARYYHSQMELELLLSGHGYEELPDTYVIFICDFDPFGEGKYRYTFEPRCVEDGKLSAGYQSKSIFLNARGENREEVPKEIASFLDFVRENTSQDKTDYEDAYVKQLQRSMERVKRSREMERRYMLLEELLEDEYKKGKRNGITEGRLENCRENIFDLLEETGAVSDELRSCIESETDLALLKKMHRLAAKAETVEEFAEAVSHL